MLLVPSCRGRPTLGRVRPTTQAVIGTPDDERNYDLVAGFVTGLAESCPGAVDEFKKKAARSHDLAPSLPQICWRLGITPHDVRLTIASLQDRVLSPSRLHLWSFGGKLSEVPSQEVASLIDTMIDHSAEGFTEAVTLMGMYAFGDADRLKGLRPQVVKLAETSARWKLTRRAQQCQHHFENIIGWMLGKGRQEPDACATALALAKAVADVQELNDDLLLKPMLPKLLSDFPEAAWPLSPNPPMRSGLGVRTRGEGRGTRRSALDSDKWGRWRPLVVVGGADGGPGQRRCGGVGGTVCRGRQSRTGPVRLCGAVG